jgi:predicted MFS family arabinose efflux permease
MNVYRAYLLRTTNEEEGGTIFGIGDNLISLAFLLGTLSIPFFAQNRSYFWLGIIIILSNLILYIILHYIKDEKFLDKPKTRFSVINPVRTISKSLDFIKKGDYFPLMTLAAALFGGLFYGSIWFIFPLKFADAGELSFIDGLELGIYDLVTVFTAGICGHLADKYNWKKMHLSGWIIVLAGMWMLPLLNFRLGLIIAGLIIGIGNNLFYYSACHALEKYDKMHKEDGAFTAFTKMCETLGYAISPLLVGAVYYYYGFTMALVAGISLSSIVALLMIVFSVRMGKFKIRF